MFLLLPISLRAIDELISLLPETTVTIVNEVGGPLLGIHYRFKQDDLGVNVVSSDKSYSFNFRPNIWGTTLFYCIFEWVKAEAKENQTRPYGLHASFLPLVGLPLAVPLPEKLKKRKERTYQSSAPEGCTYQSSAPEGCTYQSSAPEGCTYQSSAPEGCTYQSSAPEGCTYQSSAPEGRTYP
ncbi:self-incompatibility protein 1 [Cucumis melo var. makuwa]|uniref:S-protein homolog n=1 Tax=Cucumis melo var. makuwa TaxID=1194695 RepID=A0A5A7TR91_CUCMM|nr:self-incompatibility protein 1 [Cucumis melo var. makuwa]